MDIRDVVWVRPEWTVGDVVAVVVALGWAMGVGLGIGYIWGAG